MHKPIDTITSMKIQLRNTRILLAVTLPLFVSYIFYTLSVHTENTELTASANKQAVIIDGLHQEIELRDLQLTKYKADAKYIERLGATPDQTLKIIKASEAMNVSPK